MLCDINIVKFHLLIFLYSIQHKFRRHSDQSISVFSLYSPVQTIASSTRSKTGARPCQSSAGIGKHEGRLIQNTSNEIFSVFNGRLHGIRDTLSVDPAGSTAGSTAGDVHTRMCRGLQVNYVNTLARMMRAYWPAVSCARVRGISRFPATSRTSQRTKYRDLYR